MPKGASRRLFGDWVFADGVHDLDANPWRDLYLRNSAENNFADRKPEFSDTNMKTESRQEEQQNALVELFGTQGAALRPYLKAIIGGFLLAIALLFAFNSMKANQKKRAAAGWSEYFQAASEADIEGLREVAESYRGTEAGAWAIQSAGDIGLATGSRYMFTDRASGLEYLQGAEEDFKSAMTMAKSDMLKERALFGLAQSQESLNEFEGAASSYKKLIDTYPKSPLADSAKENLALLEKPSTKKFYDWFFAQNPVPKSPTGNPLDPVGGMGIKPPSPYGDLPSDPTTSLPSDSLLGGSGLMAPSEGSSEESTEESAANKEESVYENETTTPVEGAATEGTVIEGAAVEGAAVEGAAVEGGVIEEGAVEGGVIEESAAVEGTVIEGAPVEGAAVEGSIIEDAAGVIEEAVSETP